ncbi:MAG: hypothetical protein MI724_10230, partial [Spirochaetales bacterium]|nr:hypothetical protein [Spirochaetales bacterium]
MVRSSIVGDGRSNQDVVLGIDVGTSAVKVAAVSHRGPVGVTRVPCDTTYPRKGWVEQNAAAWWHAAVIAVRQLDLHRGQVKGIGVAGQLNGCVCVDRRGVPLRPAIIWLDNRATEEARYLAREFQGEIGAYGLTSPRPIHVLTKLVWMRRNEPETLERTHKVLFVKDFVVHKLTGAFATDVSDAGAALLLDIRKRRYATEFLDSVLDIDKLPEV